jgi:hypothetical protein
MTMSKQYGALLSSASRDTVGDDLVGKTYDNPNDAAEYGALVALAQPGIQYTVVERTDGGQWLECGTGRSVSDVIDRMLGPMHYRVDALAGLGAVA